MSCCYDPPVAYDATATADEHKLKDLVVLQVEGLLEFYQHSVSGITHKW